MTILQELMRRGKKSRRYIPRTTNVLLNFVFQKNAFAYTSHFFHLFFVTKDDGDFKLQRHHQGLAVLFIFYEFSN